MLKRIDVVTQQNLSNEIDDVVKMFIEKMHNDEHVQKAYHKFALEYLGLPEGTSIGTTENGGIGEDDPRYDVYYMLTQEWFNKFLTRLASLQAI